MLKAISLVLPCLLVISFGSTVAAQVQLQEMKPQQAMSMRFRAKPSDVPAEFRKSLGRLHFYVMTQGGQIIGPPFGRYHQMDANSFDVEVGVVVAKALDGNEEIKPSELPGGPVATLTYRGHFAGLIKADEALQKWAKANGRQVAGGPWAVPVIEPRQESEPDTRIFLPLEKKKGEAPSGTSPSSK